MNSIAMRFAAAVLACTVFSCGGTPVTVWKWTANGATWEPGQTEDPEQLSLFPLAPSYTFTAYEDADTDRQRFEWTNAPGVPFYLAYNYAAVVGPNGGLFDGTHDLFSQTTGAATVPMRPDRVAAFRKMERLVSPEKLLLRAQTDPGSVTVLPDETFEGRTNHVWSFTESPRPMRLFIDAETNLPAKADTLEDDPILGDALVEARFDSWVKRGEEDLPETVTLSLNGELIGEEQRDYLQSKVPLDASKLSFSSAGADVGHDTSDGLERALQYHRYLGIAEDFAQNPGPVDAVTLTDVAPGIVMVGGGRHYSLAIESDTGVIVVEAPLDERRSLNVISALNGRFPGKPITHLIATHHHHDHTGGVRTYVAKGVTLVAGAETQSYFQTLVSTPHTVQPDLLAQSPVALNFVPVGPSGFDIVDGRTVHVMEVSCAHARGMVIVYVPDAKLVFASDMTSPFPTSGEYVSPPVPRLLADGTHELYDAITAAHLDVSSIAVGAHPPTASVMTFAQLKTAAGH